MRSEWVSKLTLIQQAEMAIVSAHNSKQTELRCEVFLWIQIILSFFYLSNFLLWFALQYSLHISAARPICYHTLHAHHNLVHRYLLILRLYIIIHARKEESNYFCWFFFQSLLETRPSSLPPCKLFYVFDTSNTSYSNPVFFFSRRFQISVWNTGSSGEASAAEGPQCAWAPRTRDRGRVNSSSPCFLTLAVLCCVTFQTRLLSKLKWKWKTKDAVTAGIWALFASEDEEGAGV